MNISYKTSKKDLDYRSMCYDAKRDLFWLLVRPWIWIPRIIAITIPITFFILKLVSKGTHSRASKHNELAKDLLNLITNLGPCFIKTGQALSTRPDLVNKMWLEELINLQDNLPPFSQAKALQIFKEQIGKSTDDIFDFFPETPIASASLGQVYKARLKDNYWVAVKIQRPDLLFIIRRDLVIIKIISNLIAPILPLNLGFNLSEIVDEFGITLFEEIDYELEAKNAKKFGNLFKDDPSIFIPKVEDFLSSGKVITTSWIEGVKLKNRESLLSSGIEPTYIIRTAVKSGIQQLLEFGYFHADPHPGNIFALKGNTNKLGHLGYVDFGMMDTINELDRITLTKAIVHLINQDFNLLAKDFQTLGFLSSEQKLEAIAPILKDVLGEVLNKNVNSFNIKKITDKFSELMYEYPFRVPARFALIIRAVVSQEGLALNLDPKFKILNFAYPYVAKRLLTEQSEEMLKVLMEVIFDEKGQIRLDRLEGLLSVLKENAEKPSTELLPIARDGIKLLTSSKGSSIRRKFLLSLVKDDKVNLNDLKNLIRIISSTYQPKMLLVDFLSEFNKRTVKH